MSDIKIDDYRGFGLYYDEDENIFHSDLQDKLDMKNEPTRASLKDLKTVIDSHIKANASFKSFQALYSSLSYDSGKTNKRIPRDCPQPIKIVSVRKNGGLLVRKSKSQKDEQLNPTSYRDERQGLFLLNDNNLSLIEDIKELEKKAKSIQDAIKEKLSLFDPLDLSFIEPFI